MPPDQPVAAPPDPPPAYDEDALYAILDAAERALADDRLMTPENDSAYHYYREALAIAPDHPLARRGFERIVESYLALAGRAIERERWASARSMLDRARIVDADHSGSATLRRPVALLANARRGHRMGHRETADAMFVDGLEDAETGASMGSFAQTTADAHQITREDMDAFAISSVTKALRAMDGGDLHREIAPFGDLREDEQPRRSRVDRIPTLRPAFARDGTITAANASSISDGASALVLGDETAGDQPLARVVGHATHSIHPSDFTIAPVGAIERLLARVGWSKQEVDLFEINEAFAMVTMLAISELGLDADRVNVYGGACAQGHPIGSTGSRLLVTLAHALAATGGSKGVASLCIGGGEATAMAIERVS